MYCSNCGVGISEAAEICRKCGVRPFRTKAFCYSCGERNYNKYQIECKHCGTDLNAKTVSASTFLSIDQSWIASLHSSLPNGFKQFMIKMKRE